MRFPLDKQVLGTTCNSLSYQALDLNTQVEIPIGDHPGAFGVLRKHHIHEGVDLYAHPGDPVFTMETGTVTLIEPFTGEQVGSPWWRNTWAVHVEGLSGVLVYGEIIPNPHIFEGETVLRGSVLGHVTPVLLTDKGRPTTMLHLELHAHSSRGTFSWDLGQPQAEALLDPTPLLLEATGLI